MSNLIGLILGRMSAAKHGVDIGQTLLRSRHRRGISPAYIKPSQRTENVAIAEVLSVCKQLG